VERHVRPNCGSINSTHLQAITIVISIEDNFFNNRISSLEIKFSDKTLVETSIQGFAGDWDGWTKAEEWRITARLCQD
jgi:hypothetical protein